MHPSLCDSPQQRDHNFSHTSKRRTELLGHASDTPPQPPYASRTTEQVPRSETDETSFDIGSISDWLRINNVRRDAAKNSPNPPTTRKSVTL